MKKIRLLYAEDDPLDADLTRTRFALEAPDFEIEIADSGEKCLERLQQGDFDALLLDNHLPDMDGIDALKTLVRSGVRLPVVMVTGTGAEELVVQALRLGARDYVPKSGDYVSALPGILRRLVAEDRDQKKSGRPVTPERRRILYAEHNHMDIELTQRHFADHAAHLSLESVHTAGEALRRLAEGDDLDLVLADLRLPDMSAIEMLREAKQRTLVAPFVIVTGKGDEDAAVAALKLGAYDYVVKRENYLTQLSYTIENAIHRFRLDHATRRLHAELEALNESLEQKVTERTAKLRREIAGRKRAERELRRLSSQLLQSQDEERRRIARELHDSTGQNLAALKMNLSVVEEAAAKLGARQREALEESVALAANCARELRRLSYLLHTPLVDESGLISSLRAYAKGYSRRTGVKVKLEMPPKLGRLPDELETTLFRIVQEGLANIYRHSRSPSARIRLTARAGEVTLEISDQGRGIAPNILKTIRRGSAHFGVGISGMRDRAALLGGRLDIQSGPEGTTVTAILPRSSRSPKKR